MDFYRPHLTADWIEETGCDTGNDIVEEELTARG
jgi:hypothetical protein